MLPRDTCEVLFLCMSERLKPPGPTESFVIEPDDETRMALGRWFAEYGDICRIPPGELDDATWVVHDPQAIRHVLVRNHRNYTKGRGLDRVRILLGNGIMVSEGAFWQRQRRMIQPAFRNAVLQRFSGLIRDENLALAAQWRAAASTGTPVDVADGASQMTLSIVLKSIFGPDLDVLAGSGTNPFTLLAEEPERNLAFAARFRALTKVVGKIVAQRRQQGRDEPDFLGMLMAATGRDDGQPMPDKVLIDEVMTLIVAGHETTASALAWIWYLVSTHPEVAAGLRAEVDGLSDAAIDSDSALELGYATQIVREALRLYPPGWLLSRRAVGDDLVGGYPVAAGSHMFVCPWIVHRHPDYWDEPEVFKPERFARENVPAHRFAYIPFAAGPRHCVGETLAMMEMLMHVALMARRFEFEYAGDAPPRLESHINLRPRDGVSVRLTRRE